MNLELLSLPIILAAGNYIGIKTNLRNKSVANSLRSFTAGFSVGYVFLYLWPELLTGDFIYPQTATIIIMLGFVFFHVLLKFIFSQKDIKRRQTQFDRVHLLVLSVYSALISFTVVELAKINFADSIIITVLILIHTVLAELTHKDLYILDNERYRLPLVVLASLAGGFLPILIIFNSLITNFIFAFAAGAIIYITLREEIPTDEQNNSKPLLFLVGSIVFMLISIIWLG